MEKLVNYFQHIASWQRTLAVVLGIVIFWLLEGIFPLFRFRYNKFRHAGLNLFFTLTTIMVNLAFAYFIVVASNYTNSRQLGLLHIVQLPLWLYILAGLMILDFISAWLIHWIQHQVKWMWKFHIIHHADMQVDTTTANRHHPVESIFRAVFTFIAVAVAGAPIWMLFMYQFLSVLCSQFNHANITLPRWLDKFTRWFLVTPDMHKVHHHYVQPLTDTNYGNIFSFWDRLFRTYASVDDVKTLKYGIDTHMGDGEHDQVNRLLKIPFEEYRPPAGSKFSIRG